MQSIKKIVSATALSLLTPLLIAHADWSTGLTEAGGFNLPNEGVENIITSFLSWLLAMLAIFAVLAFVISGIMFMMAGSSTAMAEKAKAMVGYSIIGIVVGISGYIIIMFIDNFLMGASYY
jgi:hypothetical protein